MYHFTLFDSIKHIKTFKVSFYFARTIIVQYMHYIVACFSKCCNMKFVDKQLNNFFLGKCDKLNKIFAQYIFF